jgi:hypothetical protein
MKWMGLAVLVGLCRVAAAEPARDTIEIDGEILGPFLVWIGGSLHYEHRAADSNLGLTLRAGVTPGVVIGADEDAEFTRVTGIVGVRRHWTHAYLEAAAGWSGFRHDRVLGPDDEHFGIRWNHVPDLEVELGVRLGPVDVGLFVAPIGLGVRLGAAFEVGA